MLDLKKHLGIFMFFGGLGRWSSSRFPVHLVIMLFFLRLYPQLRGFVTMFDDLTKMDWFREHAQKNRVPVNVLFNHF
jgi:hypothetical protein